MLSTAYSSYFWTCLRRAALCVVMCQIFNCVAAQAVSCFCTDTPCTYGYCESPWCLVGVKQNGKVIRSCGKETSEQLQPCAHNVGEWLDVCSCITPFCNSFAFFREKMRLRGTGSPSDTVAMSRESKSRESPVSDRRRSRKKGGRNDGPVVFDRNDDKSAATVRQSYLVIVLIIVPLAVAGTAVIIVVIGYYCKMC